MSEAEIHYHVGLNDDPVRHALFELVNVLRMTAWARDNPLGAGASHQELLCYAAKAQRANWPEGSLPHSLLTKLMQPVVLGETKPLRERFKVIDGGVKD